MNELIDKLQDIGISRREAEVYLALLKKKEFYASELAKVTTITRTKIYEILQNLVHKGLCNESYRDGQKIFRGIKPQIAIENIVSNYAKEIEQKKNAAVALEKELVSLHENNLQNNDSLDYIEVLTDVGQIRERWLQIQSNAQEEILVFTKPPYAQALYENVEILTELIKKNKIIDRCVYEYNDSKSIEERNETIRMIELYQEVGVQARIFQELPMKLAITDEKITMLALNDPVSMKPSITTMVVSHPSFAKAQKEVFESYWNKSISLEDFKKLKTI